MKAAGPSRDRGVVSRLKIKGAPASGPYRALIGFMRQGLCVKGLCVRWDWYFEEAAC